MAQITNCLKLISRINEGDQDSLISRIDELQALGVPAQRAQVQAAIDVLARLQRDAGGIQRTIKRERALETNVPMEMPADPVFMAAVENTPGARVDDEGLHMRLVRWQKPEQEAGRAIRTGVFYLPEGSSNARHYRSAPSGDDSQSYGGSVRMEGETLIRRPLFVRGATGGKAPEAAYAALHGKEAMKKLDSDVFGVLNERAWMTRQGADIYQERVENLLRDYGADPQLAADIIHHSRQGNQLRYALQENIIAHAVRAAGYDAVVGHSKGKSGPFISEVFDVREQTFPSNIIESEVHQDFSSDITRSAKRDVTETPEFKAWFGDSKVVDADGKPLVVYHGTTGNIRDFKSAGGNLFWVTPSHDLAASLNGRRRKVLPLYVKSKNPFDPHNESHVALIADQFDRLYGRSTFSDWRRRIKDHWKVWDDFRARNIVMRSGFDSIWSEEDGARTLALIGEDVPSRVKSANRNNGQFDPANPDITRSTKRSRYAWSEREDTADGPVLRGDGFYLLPQREIAQDDFGDGGFGENGLLGHAERVVPGTRTFAFRIVGDDGKLAGVLVSDVDETGALRSIHDIEIDAKRSGLGSKIVATIAANTSEPIKIQDITNEADPFWTRIGVGYKDPYGDASLDWEDVAQYVGSRAAAPVDQDWAFAQDGSRGLSPDSYEVRELSPEELDGIQFSTKRNDLGFYSALERGIEGMQTKQAPAGAWKAQIKGLVNKGIVKHDEITWSGIEDWLDLQEGKVSKEAISEYLRQGGVQVQEVVLGNQNDRQKLSNEYERAIVASDAAGGAINPVYIESLAPGDRKPEEQALLDAWNRINENPDESWLSEAGSPKYDQYTIPGGPLSRDTEILTRDGWLRMDAVQIGDEVMTRRDEDGALEWQPVEAVPTVFAEKLYHFKNQSINMRVSPCHKMVVKRRRRSTGEILRVTAEQLWSMSEMVAPLTGSWGGGEFSDLFGQDAGDVAELLGWYIAEGHAKTEPNGKKSSIGIAQCRKANADKCARIEALLDRMSIEWNYSGGQYWLRTKKMSRDLVQLLWSQGKAAEKYVPGFMFNAPASVISRLLDGLLLGDGCRASQPGRKPRWAYHTISRQLADDVQVLALLIGKRGTISRRKNGLYVVNINDKQWASIDDAKHGVVDYNDTAYCVTVKNHSIYVRTGGVAAFTGNSNYREVLITLPDRVKAIDYNSKEFRDAAALQYGEKFVDQLSQYQRDLVAKKMQGTLGKDYRSSHWDQKNVLAHIRVNDRVDANGRKVLFVEELQSDWGQDGKKKGVVKSYRPDEVQPISAIEAGKMTSADEELFWHFKTPDNVFSIPKSKYADRDAAREYIIREKKINSGGVPDAPFIGKTEGWLNLAIKRVIAMAVDGDYDAVAFVNGDQSADRYDLSKQISRVRARLDNGAWALMAHDSSGRLVLDEYPVAEDELENYVGKELAQRIAKDGGGIYSGLDLKVGGEGMKAFYDKIVPNAVKALLKKVGGGQVSEINLGKGLGTWVVEEVDRYDGSSSVLGEFPSEERAEDFASSREEDDDYGDTIYRVRRRPGADVLIQPGFAITESMREKVSTEGLPLFSRKRGWQGFPDSVVDTNLGAQSKDPSYDAAKAGDMKAALELVSRVMSSDAEDKVRRMIGDSKPIVVSVHAEEAAGRNKIPLATAIELGDRLGLEVDTKIVQATRAKRTGADGMARIGVQPEFTGDVVRGADYLIVDDTLTQGGTIAQLKTHIEEGGGRVVGVFALSGKQYSAKISLDEQTLSQLRERYGSIEPWWRSELGYGFDGLTQSEARFILKSGLSPDQVRDRVAAARQAAGIGAGAQDQARLSTKRDVTDTPEFKRWFGSSKVVDADGKPLVVYHGTSANVTTFSDKMRRGGGVSKLGKAGIYFTTDAALAALYGEATYPVYLKAENPLSLPSTDFPSISSGLIFPDEAAEIQAAGYDAVTSGSVIVVFNPEQIKSATGNSGQFDPASADITKSLPRIPGLNAGPVERTTGDYGREYTPQQLRMFKNVGRTTSKPALIDRLKEARKDLGKKMAQGIVDQFRPIRELGGNAYTLARLSKGSAGAFEALLGHGKLKIVDGAYDADTTGGFLDLVGKPLGKELEDFMFWVASNRAEALSFQDREHLFTQEDIDAGKSLADGDLEFDYLLANGATTRDRRAAYEDALKKFNEFNKNVLDIAEQSGLVDGESRQFWEGEFYVPFYRVSEEDGEFVGAKIKGGLARQRAFHELKGGSQKLNSDLLANTMRNWAHLIDASAKNRAAKATLEAAQAVGVALESDAETVRQLGKSMGGKGGTVWFMDGGQQRHFLIGDPYLLEAINSLEYAGLRGPLMDALSTMKHWLTVGVTASPAFKVRNLIRDSIQAISLSGLSYNPVKNLVEGYKATDRESQDYVSALASGGLIRFGTMLEGNAAERVRRLVQKGVPASTILNTPGKVKDFYGKFVEPAVEAYQELGNRGEEINRASLYKQLRAQGVNHAEASLMARDLMDFSMQGTWTGIRFLTQVVPFLNARLQGLYKLGRGAAEDPKRFAMVAGATAMVSIALLGAYGDDDDWKKREDWDRDGFWWFKFGGTAFRIPKPFEVGAIATLAERGVELFTNDEFTAKRFGSRVMHLLSDNLAMNPIPQAVKPMLDIYANKDSFSGRPIESMGMERLQSEYRYNVNTSMIARGASSALNAVTRTVGADSLSPVQIDSLIRGYFGWLGTFVVAGADMAVRPLTSEPARPQADYLKVVTQGFLRTLPEPGSKYVSAMYDQAKILEQAFATHRQMLKEGKLDEAREFAAENKDLLDRYRLIEAVKKTQSNVNRRIREIEISDMDPARKRDEIQKLRDQADRSARAVY